MTWTEFRALLLGLLTVNPASIDPFIPGSRIARYFAPQPE